MIESQIKFFINLKKKKNFFAFPVQMISVLERGNFCLVSARSSLERHNPWPEILLRSRHTLFIGLPAIFLSVQGTDS